MAEDRIIVDVDDSAVDMAIAKIQLYLSQYQQATGTRNIIQGISKTTQAAQQLESTVVPVTEEVSALRSLLIQLGTADLPSLNREMRVILGTIPGMRDFMWAYFGFKREYAAIGKSIVSGAVTLNLVLATLTTIILIMRGLEARQRRLEQYERQVKRFAKQREFTSAEWKYEYMKNRNYVRSWPG